MSLRKLFRKVAPLALAYVTGGSSALLMAAAAGGTASKLGVGSMLMPSRPQGASDALMANFFPEVLEGGAVGAITGVAGGPVGAAVGAAVGAGAAAVHQIAQGDYPFSDSEDAGTDEGYDETDYGDYADEEEQ